MKKTTQHSPQEEDIWHNTAPSETNEDQGIVVDFSDMEEVRKAVIMSEILNRKY
ncbi:MAG: hypothetical protein J6T32_05050 [Paludibacteraceae bacterium]|nr:hypothetical protein [Paludibacteraceae bacterium]